MVVTNNGWGISTPACSAARREARSSTAARRSASPARWWTATTRSPAWHAVRRGLALLPAAAPAVHARGAGVAAARPLVVERAPPASRARPTASTLFERQAARGRACWSRRELEQVHAEAKAEVEAAVEQALREPKPTAGGHVQAHLRPQPGGRGVPRGLHGTAAVTATCRWRRCPRPRPAYPDLAALRDSDGAAETCLTQLDLPCAGSVAVENVFDHPQSSLLKDSGLAGGLPDCTRTTTSASPTTRASIGASPTGGRGPSCPTGADVPKCPQDGPTARSGGRS